MDKSRKFHTTLNPSKPIRRFFGACYVPFTNVSILAILVSFSSLFISFFYSFSSLFISFLKIFPWDCGFPQKVLCSRISRFYFTVYKILNLHIIGWHTVPQKFKLIAKRNSFAFYIILKHWCHFFQYTP